MDVLSLRKILGRDLSCLLLFILSNLLFSPISKAGLWDTWTNATEAWDASLERSEAGAYQTNVSAWAYLGDAYNNYTSGTGSVMEPLRNAASSSYKSLETTMLAPIDAFSSASEVVFNGHNAEQAVSEHWDGLGINKSISEATHPSVRNEFASTPTNSSNTSVQNSANALNGESNSPSTSLSRPSDAFGKYADSNSEVTSQSIPSNSVSYQSPNNSIHEGSSNPNSAMSSEVNSAANSSVPTESQENYTASNNTSEKAPNPESQPSPTPSACITSVCQEFIQILGSSTNEIKNNPSAMVPGAVTSVSSMESQSIDAGQLQNGSQQMAVGNQANNEANMNVIKKVDKYEEAALGQLYDMQTTSTGTYAQRQMVIDQAHNDMEYIKAQTTQFYKWAANEIHASQATRQSITSLSGYSFGIGSGLDK